MSHPLSKSLVLSVLIKLTHCGLLGYGTGEGSCAAAPFRSQLRFERPPSVHKLFLNMWGLSGIIAANEGYKEPPAMQPFKNPLTPFLFLHVCTHESLSNLSCDVLTLTLTSGISGDIKTCLYPGADTLRCQSGLR